MAASELVVKYLPLINRASINKTVLMPEVFVSTGANQL